MNMYAKRPIPIFVEFIPVNDTFRVCELPPGRALK